MKAMLLKKTGPIDDTLDFLELTEIATPRPANGELLVKVSACGVCHTELDEIEGRLVPPSLPVVLGHEIVGIVVEIGLGVTSFDCGDRVGIGWIHHSSGEPDENLSPEFRSTGCSVNGGYAEYVTVPESYAVAIPDNLTDTHAAPLLCAGAIGYRVLRLTEIEDGEPIGLMGFGASGHLVLPTAKYLFPNSPVYVFSRGKASRQFALDLGADWAGDIDADPPQSLQSIIDTTPAWKPVISSLKNLRPGGRLVINAIRKEDTDKDALLGLSYHEHLWMEREIKSVANLTHRDIAEFLPLAASISIQPTVTTYPLEQANEALRDLRNGKVSGANVLVIGR